LGRKTQSKTERFVESLLDFNCHWADEFLEKLIAMDWNKRSDKIHRLKEKENFRAVIMPLSYWGAGLGFVALLWEGIVKIDEGFCHPAVLVPAAFFFFSSTPSCFLPVFKRTLQ